MVASKQGWIEIDPSQRWKISPKQKDLRLTANMIVRAGASVVLPSTLVLHGISITLAGNTCFSGVLITVNVVNSWNEVVVVQ